VVSDPELSPFELVVPAAASGARLDRFLVETRPDVSRSTFQRWMSEGRVDVDGRPGEPSLKIRAGARVVVRPAPPPPSTAIPEDLPLAVLYEDADLVVVDKAAGMVVHPAPGHPTGTLVNAFLFRYGVALGDDEDAPDPTRPGIVHRLDRGTSGVMVIARTGFAREHLMKLFATHDIERSYLAIVQGDHPASATYETLHGRHPTDRKKFTGRTTRGKRARTDVERIARLRGASLIRCTLSTGRTHQIRVHLSEAGFPLLGDPTYGSAPREPGLRKLSDGLGRQALHAEVLGFAHPRSGAPLRFQTPLPADLEALLQGLR
jgi:23S rRNA pseudouridine1911/1915/1917 synthase